MGERLPIAAALHLDLMRRLVRAVCARLMGESVEAVAICRGVLS